MPLLRGVRSAPHAMDALPVPPTISQDQSDALPASPTISQDRAAQQHMPEARATSEASAEVDAPVSPVCRDRSMTSAPSALSPPWPGSVGDLSHSQIAGGSVDKSSLRYSLDTTAPQTASPSRAAVGHSQTTASSAVYGATSSGQPSHQDSSLITEMSQLRACVEMMSRQLQEQNVHLQDLAPGLKDSDSLFGDGGSDTAGELRSLAEEFKMLSASLAVAEEEGREVVCGVRPKQLKSPVAQDHRGNDEQEDNVKIDLQDQFTIEASPGADNWEDERSSDMEDRREALLDALESRVENVMQREMQCLNVDGAQRVERIDELEERLESALHRFETCMQHSMEQRYRGLPPAAVIQHAVKQLRRPQSAGAAFFRQCTEATGDPSGIGDQLREALAFAQPLSSTSSSKKVRQTAPRQDGSVETSPQRLEGRRTPSQLRSPDQPGRSPSQRSTSQRSSPSQRSVSQRRGKGPTPAQLAACGVLRARLGDLLDPSPEEQIHTAIYCLKATVGSHLALKMVQAQSKTFMAQQLLMSLGGRSPKRRLFSAGSRSSSRLRVMLADPTANYDDDSHRHDLGMTRTVSESLSHKLHTRTKRPAFVPPLAIERVQFGEDVEVACDDDATMHPGQLQQELHHAQSDLDQDMYAAYMQQVQLQQLQQMRQQQYISQMQQMQMQPQQQHWQYMLSQMPLQPGMPQRQQMCEDGPWNVWPGAPSQPWMPAGGGAGNGACGQRAASAPRARPVSAVGTAGRQRSAVSAPRQRLQSAGPRAHSQGARRQTASPTAKHKSCPSKAPAASKCEARSPDKKQVQMKSNLKRASSAKLQPKMIVIGDQTFPSAPDAASKHSEKKMQRPQSSPALKGEKVVRPVSGANVGRQKLAEQEACYFLNVMREKISAEWPPLAMGRPNRPRTATAA